MFQKNNEGFGGHLKEPMTAKTLIIFETVKLKYTQFLLSLHVYALLLAMNRRGAPLNAADGALMELAVAHLFQDAAPLHLTREVI